MSPVVVSTVAHGAAVLADPGTTGLQSWMQGNIITVLVLVIGAVILIAATRGHGSKVMMTFSLAMVGLFWLGLASTNSIGAVSTWMVHLIGIA